MLVRVILVLQLVIAANSLAQVMPGARNIALGGAVVTGETDIFTHFTNPSALTFYGKPAAGFFYSPSPFGLKELATMYGVIVYPSSAGSFSAGFMRYGFELYNEVKLSAGYSAKVDEGLYAGGSIIYHTLSIPGYGSDGILYFSVGSTAEITGDISAGFYAENITNAGFGGEEGTPPFRFGAGGAYSIEDFNLYVSARKESGYPFSFHSGIEYNFSDLFYLRAGIKNEPESFSAGAGLEYMYVNFDYAVYTHNELGLTHQAGVIVSM